jgi:S-formylglutathione hydrolase FrmB
MNRRRVALAGLLTVLAGLVVTVTGSSAQATPPLFQSGDGISIVSATSSDARTWHLVVSTGQLSKAVRVNVLLPADYATTTRDYPTLYLFHGTSGGADDWLDQGNAEAATAPYPLIVVMPDAGYNGNGGSWFTNWVDQHTSLGRANWETFDIDQLVPWIDANLRTIDDRSGRAIAGLSQGGFGSFSYAARHPDLFSSVAAFSGAPDIASNVLVKAAAETIIGGTALGLDGVEPNAMFGDPVTDDINWRGHNPASLVTNLSHTDLDLWSGNGLPGPFDTASPATVSAGALEAVVHTSALSFTAAATTAHIPYYFDDYGPGTHSFPYWSRDLVQYLPRLMQTLDDPAPAPTSITYKSIDKSWTQWGWSVTTVRPAAQAWSELDAASATGFTLVDPNTATVSTPAIYHPLARYKVNAVGGTTAATVTAGLNGRITLSVRPATGHMSVVIGLSPIA